MGNMAALDILEKLKHYGVGRRNIDDDLFINDKPPARLGVYDDDENLCHDVVKSTCNIPGCSYTAQSLLEFEEHYNTCHRYSCGQCKKMLPSAHLLDLHLQETHDSFFAVMAEKKPSFCCYIEECKEKFINTEERHNHCVTLHKLPKDFRFEQKPKSRKKKTNNSMDLDVENTKEKKIVFSNNKQKTFPKYTGKKFTSNSKAKASVDIEMVVDDLKESLPE